MNGIISKLIIKEYECQVYVPEEYSKCEKNYKVLYINGADDLKGIMEKVEPSFAITLHTFLAVSIKPKSWNDEYTPWRAPAVIKQGEDFGGHAEGYITILTNEIKAFIDKNYRVKAEREDTALIGYSLGGLASLYTLYKSDMFGKIGSLSGSLWYDNWIEYMESHLPVYKKAKVYLSLGRGEERSRNIRVAKVGSCTEKAKELLENQLESAEKIILEWNNGGHFSEIPERFKKAILWLMGE